MCPFLGVKRSKWDSTSTVLADPIMTGSGKRCRDLAGRRMNEESMGLMLVLRSLAGDGSGSVGG